jgi:hypothetical protein
MVMYKKKHSDKSRVNQGRSPDTPNPNRIAASTHYDFKGKNLTPYGGLFPVATMLERLGLQKLVEETLLIERAADARESSIIDVGGGESTLVDDLLLRGYKNLTCSMSRRPQSKSRESDWVRLQSRFVGWSVISSKSGWNNMPTISGMTEPYSIFLPHQSDVLPTFGRLPALSSQVAT